MRLSLLHRIGLLILAMLPVAWGNCPGWFHGQESGGDAAAADARVVCPCCAKRAPDERPLRGCDDCPIVAVRRTASQVPPTVVLPPPAFVGLALPARLERLDGAAVAVAPAHAPEPPGAPPDLVGTVVLLV